MYGVMSGAVESVGISTLQPTPHVATFTHTKDLSDITVGLLAMHMLRYQTHQAHHLYAKGVFQEHSADADPVVVQATRTALEQLKARGAKVCLDFFFCAYAQ
jgi:hypothetical protein